MYCRECGQQIADDSKFCQSCGKKQSGIEVIPALPKEQETKIPSVMTEKEGKPKLENIFADIESKPKKTKSKGSGCFEFISIMIIVIIAIIIVKLMDSGSQTNQNTLVEKATGIFSQKEKQTKQKIARVKYEVIGTASSVNITLTTPNGTEQYSHVKLPGSYEFSVPIGRNSFDYYHAMIMAQNNGASGNVTVTIYVNGKKFKTATSNGAYVIASADGAVGYGDIE